MATGTLRSTKAPLSRAEKIVIATADESTKSSINKNIAAIDFGTTSLSLAYTTQGDDQVSVFSFDSNSNVPRVPNAILIEKLVTDETSKDINYEVVAIGTTAQTQYYRSRAEKRRQFVYFERIKMMLMKYQEISRKSHVVSITGEVFYLVQVIAFILKRLAHELQDRLSKGVKPIKKHEFDWVITVPAIWSAKGKRLMREAVYLSGILTEDKGISNLSSVLCGVPRPDEINPHKLTLALEPEAAAIYSQIMSSEEASKVGVKMSPGYMVIDAGGGTIDITAQIEVKGGVKIVSIPTGNDWGGTKVNMAFSKKFQQIVGDDGFTEFLHNHKPSKKCQSDFTNSNEKHNLVEVEKLIFFEFESQKVSFGQGKISEIAIEVPRAFVDYYGEDRIIEGIENIEGYEFDDDRIYVSKQASEDLFSEALDAIVDCFLEAFSAEKCQVSSHEIGTVYLVGGFGDCKLLYKRLQKVLESQFSHVRLISPVMPLLAVVQGAVLGKKDPSYIKARPSDVTYGIAVQLEFESSKWHDIRYMYENTKNKKKYIKDVFEVFLLKGEQASYKDKFISNLSVPSDDAKEVTLDIYSTYEEGIQYVNTPEGKPLAQRIGQLIVDTPNPDKLPLNKRRIEVSMSFSGTEIQATAKHNKKEVKTVCDFLSSS